MIKVIDFIQSNFNDINPTLNQCSSKGYPLVIKNLLKFKTLNDFDNFLTKKMLYVNDDRQFNLKNYLESKKWFTINYDKMKSSFYTHSKTRQPLHNDNAWFSNPAEMVFLAFEKQAVRGGETIVYELNDLLTDLRAEEKELLNDLQNVNVVIKKDITGKYFNRTTIINREDSIYWNYYRIEKKNRSIKNMCDMFFKYLKRKEHTSSVQKFRCKTSDMLCFNDTKLLHGRLGFSAIKQNDRILHQSMWYLNNELNHG